MKLDDQKIKTILRSLPNRGDMLNLKCPTREIIDSLTGLWGLLILRALSENEVLRNAELKRLVPGISEKMLAQTLRRLERIGFIERVSYPEIPPRVEYSLSKIGRRSSKMLIAFCEFLEENFKPIAHRMLIYDQADHSRPWQKPRR
jgi:DNA-binding HxlR family transcriptional regulator